MNASELPARTYWTTPWQREASFTAATTRPKTFNCFQGNMLTSLMDLGCKDERLDPAYEWTARTVTGEDLPAKVTREGLAAADSSSGKLFPLSLHNRATFFLSPA